MLLGEARMNEDDFHEAKSANKKHRIDVEERMASTLREMSSLEVQAIRRP